MICFVDATFQTHTRITGCRARLVAASGRVHGHGSLSGGEAQATSCPPPFPTLQRRSFSFFVTA